MELIISCNEDGSVQSLYNDSMELQEIGNINIKRASFVEPEGNLWYADLKPINGPKLGPFKKRTDALNEEHNYINNLLQQENIKL
jgi:hypothetical protein